MSCTIDWTLNYNAWPFEEAKRVYEYIGRKTPKKGYVLFQTGYGPSGLPHIGTFAEVARTTMVRRTFERMYGIPTKLICFSDDMDGLRKVPGNLPNQDLIARSLGKPLTSVPDPFGECQSFGHYMNGKLKSFLDRFGFDYSFYSATECYKSGMFDEMLLKALDRYEHIMSIMLPTLRDERRKSYSPFMPICPESGAVLQVPIERLNHNKGTITYRNARNEEVEVPVTGGHCKLQWKPDFSMRWAAFDVDYEMYGKEHMANGPIYDKLCVTFGGRPPIQYFYELFLDESGSKISKSKGNSVTIDQWLSYAPVESLSFYIYQSPSRAKRLRFDVIPKNVDDYLTSLNKYHIEQDPLKKYSNPVFYLGTDVPCIDTYDISFALLLNLASVCNPEDKSILWKFISQYAPDATPENAPYLDRMTECAVNYYNNFIKDTKEYIVPDQNQKKLLLQIKFMLETLEQQATAESIQNAIYAIGREAGYDNLRDFFKDIYQILLGHIEGPRLGSFFKLYGIDSAIQLIGAKCK